MKLKNVSHYAIYDQKFDNWKMCIRDSFHAALKPIFRSLKPFQAFSSLFSLRARVFSFYMNTYILRLFGVCAGQMCIRDRPFPTLTARG